jgi:hypothetical protein
MGSETENLTDIWVHSLSGALVILLEYADLLSTKKGEM